MRQDDVALFGSYYDWLEYRHSLTHASFMYTEPRGI